MADFENSRFLPTVTRRNLIVGVLMTASDLISTPQIRQGPNPTAPPPIPDDVALAIGREWAAAHRQYAELFHLRYDLSKEIARLAPIQDVEICVGDAVFFASTKDDIDELLRGRLEMAETQRQALTNLAALDAAWNDADDRIGYSRTIDNVKQASDLCSRRAALLRDTPAMSIAGAAAKLRCFIEMNTQITPWSKHLHPELRLLHEEPSFPDLRSILADLDRMTEAGNV